MLNGQNDQAAGLRSLFGVTPQRVVGVVPCSALVMPSLARQVQARSRSARVLALDEESAYGKLADALSVSSRFDLLQAVEGQASLGDCLVNAGPSFRLASVSRLARMFGCKRMLNQRILRLLSGFRPYFDEWFLLARAVDSTGVSRFLRAAPDLVLVSDGGTESVTLAYATLKCLGEDKGRRGVAVVMPLTTPRPLAKKFQKVVGEQLGVIPILASSLDEALTGITPVAESGCARFLDRLLQVGSMPGPITEGREASPIYA